ncbi:MAG: hypothetical protein OXF41_15085 [bacterium]|nr:hypothetical protein [bacterium]
MGGEEVLEHSAQQFGVECYVLVDGCVLFEGELVGVEQCDDPVGVEEETVRDGQPSLVFWGVAIVGVEAVEE